MLVDDDYYNFAAKYSRDKKERGSGGCDPRKIFETKPFLRLRMPFLILEQFNMI